MKKIKVQTWLPVFPGFYGTIFEACEDAEIDDINDQRDYKCMKPVEYNEIEFDYEDYKIRVSQRCVEFIERELADVFKSKIVFEYECVSSPREYNFTNDSIHITAVISKSFLRELKRYLKRNEAKFAEYISRSYTSRSGFASFYSNSCHVWLTEYFNEIEDNKHYLGSLLQFVCENEDINEHDMLGFVCDETYLSASNYYELIGEDITKTE